ncbi:LHFPL tetraspan subfamily member 4 protein-like isoform X2 [Vespa mandarinia]|uniref:LHFPL tetraspan subfamily member 4 protein-like isoform X2 n=1 Tax=Vespa mandarinia TaxID=7446 RepID=UPI00160D7F00|nr:LHFPL tetraspan subfamily member 4 protein-like isoform X2 [Vespa mandarinia]XP_046831501.1 LHFPL tetraspan subfamily member 4 protein-like isoform X2 [Vespa crabro]XP_047367452.1 LHFPL tetraspan subfamily member 4 protein-like isoform X2 [Vespa velutina]
MGSKIEYVESSHMYATNYIRNSKAIGVLWGIFTICYAIIGVVAFVTPEWLGDLEHENPGRFGLWTRCSYGNAICMAIGVCVYPLGWDSPAIRAVCGASASRYNPGACAVRWAIPLAAIAALDATTLAALAFILASRHVRLQPEPFNNGSLYKGEVNPGYVNEAQSVAGSRKSLSLRPVLLVAPPEQDRYSELSRAKSHSHHSLYTPAPSHPVHTVSTNTLNHSQHNFQL